MVFWAPLFIIQIGVAIGTLAVVWKMSRQKKQLASLKSELGQALDGFPKEIIENVSQHAWKSNRIEAITGDRHFEALVEAIEEARLRLIIMSGWVTNYVVDEDMEQRLRAALARGVDVFVGFGWTPEAKRRSRSQSGASPEAARMCGRGKNRDSAPYEINRRDRFLPLVKPPSGIGPPIA
jgi:hypothetical protein